jgi:hypothetical protein
MTTNRFEAAMIDMMGATDSRGLKIMLMPYNSLQGLPSPQAFVNRIHELTAGMPLSMDGMGGSAEYENLAVNVGLLANALKECVRYQGRTGSHGCKVEGGGWPKTNAQLDNLYKSLPVTCDLSTTALEECAIRMKAHASYKLFVHQKQFPYACMLVKHMGGESKDHPFAPFINVVILDTLKHCEWFIEGDAFDAWGSPGV